jgi:hypothetical protein
VSAQTSKWLSPEHLGKRVLVHLAVLGLVKREPYLNRRRNDNTTCQHDISFGEAVEPSSLFFSADAAFPDGRCEHVEPFDCRGLCFTHFLCEVLKLSVQKGAGFSYGGVEGLHALVHMANDIAVGRRGVMPKEFDAEIDETASKFFFCRFLAHGVNRTLRQAVGNIEQEATSATVAAGQ